MESSPSWQANSPSATQEFPEVLLNLKVHSRVYETPSLVPILSQMNPVHTTPSYILKILLNIIFQLKSGSS
jgi:hypothetical protein